MRVLLLASFLFTKVLAQDSTVSVDHKVVTLREVVVRNNLDVPKFMQRVQLDTSFYKAFKNLHVLGFSSLNDIRMMGKSQQSLATLQSRTRQVMLQNCRHTEILQEHATGDIYDNNHQWNYYTAELYAGLMFANDTICGEDNIVQGDALRTSGKSGIEKHKEQLKMLFFNPGKEIPGIPFIGDKIAIFEPEQAKRYDFSIDMQSYQGENCYVFIVKAREDLNSSERNNVVINEMTTWFNANSLEIVARSYDLSYDAGVYDFDVQMQVELTHFHEYLVPKLIRYNGNWHALFKKRERGIFTATLFDFNGR
jgi:hypothetical protein